MIQFFRKLFKALNSSQTPWQMSLAISMGMAMGLTPYSGLQTVVLILIVLIVNVHIGLFLVSSTLFAGIGYLLDPYFEQLGYVLLNMDALEGIFTMAYNSGLLRLTYFNNTIVLGSNVVAFALLLPMFFLLNKIVYVYRDKIASKLQQYPIFKILGISVSGTKDKMYRIWGIGVFAVLGGGTVLLVILFLDILLKSAIEDGFTLALKKKVSVENLETSFSKGSININNLYVADEKKAVVMAKNINVGIDFNQLLFRRYHIENIDVTGMAFHTEVKDKSLLYTEKSKSSSQAGEKTEEKGSEKGFILPSLSLEDPKVLMGRMGISSLSGFDETKEKINTIKTKYKNIIEKDFSKSEMDRLSSEVKDIQSKLKSKDVSAMIQLKDDVSELNKKIKAKKELLKTTKKEFIEDKNSIKKAYDMLSQGAVNDYNNLKSQYKFDETGGVNVAGVLFGEKIKGYLGAALKYYEIAKPYIKSKDKKAQPPVPPRGEGRWIAFKYKIPTVDFLIKSSEVSGVLQEQDFRLLVKNVSSNPQLLKAPMTFSLKSDGKQLKELAASGKNEHINQHVKTTSSFSLSEGNVQSMDMSFMNLDKAKYGFNGKLEAEDYFNLNAQTRVVFSGVSLSLKQTESKLMKSLSEVVREINSFDLDVKLNGSIVNPEVSIASNLDKKLSGVFSSVFKNEVKKYQDELKLLIDNQVNAKLKELGLEEEGLGEIDMLLNGQSVTLESLLSSTSGMQDSFKNKAEDQAKEKVKSLFKGF